jgi:ankyrin repeat domain-containing protein 50
MEGRDTTRPEDKTYGLYGILGVTLGANYGENHEGAKERLLNALHHRRHRDVEQADHYRRIVDWLSPPDPETNHQQARLQHERGTGDWLLRHSRYLSWRSGSCRVLWIYGKPGSGKTVLCSTAVEDMRDSCQYEPDIGHAIFYFSFADNRKQTYQDLLLSLVAQLSNREPGRSMLHRAYAAPERRLPGLDQLKKVLFAALTSYKLVFIHIDALDECPEHDNTRQKVLDGIAELLAPTRNVRILVTSRDIPDVRHCMDEMCDGSLSLEGRLVNNDIQRYVSTELARDRRLCRLDVDMKTLIEETLTQKADGM